MLTGFAIVIAFLTGAYAMFKVSLYYNNKIIDAIRGREYAQRRGGTRRSENDLSMR